MPGGRRLDDGTRQDSRPPPSRAMWEQKLHLAVARLGVGFADAANLVRFDPKADTAYWRFDPRTGEERIGVGPAVVALDADSVEIVLRHEILHRSMFHAFGERYTDPGLANLTLDICINRLLYSAYPRAMRTASAVLYPEASKTTPIALADCTAKPHLLPPNLKQLWTRIWRPAGPGGPSLSPSSLYYQLLRMGVGQGIAHFYRDRHYAPTALPSPALGRCIDGVLSELSKRLPGGSRTAEELSTFAVSPMRIGTGRVEEFLRAMRVRRVVDPTARALTEHLRSPVRVQAYPLYPTRLGLVYRALGLSDSLRLFWNRDLQPLGERMALGIYVDVSESMVDHYPLVVGLIDALKEFPLRIRAFDDEVREVEVGSLARGRVLGGGGTDFDKPVEDLILDPDLVAGLLVTDGDGDLDEAVGRRLERSSKSLFVVYLRASPAASSPEGDSLGRYATETLTIPTAGLGA